MAIVLTCAFGWLGWSLLVGALANRLPDAWIDQDGWLTRPRPWGETAVAYEHRLAIRRWKGCLPDGGNALPGGVRKAALVRLDRLSLQQLCRETRRAELVHLALWPFWIVTGLWLPLTGVLVNLVFATAFNLPCLWVQRYNRLRLQALLRRWPSVAVG